MQLDIEQIIDNSGGDKDLVESIAKIFINKHQVLIDDMIKATQDKDCEKLWRTAHTLKGTVSYFLVDNINQLVKDIEIGGRSGDVEQCSTDKIEELQSLVSELVASLNESFFK